MPKVFCKKCTQLIEHGATCDCKPYWVDWQPSPIATITGGKPIHARDVDTAAERFVASETEEIDDGDYAVYVFDGAQWFVLTVEIETAREVYVADCIPFTFPAAT